MNRLSRHSIYGLIISVTVLIFAGYWLIFRPIQVISHTVAISELRGEVMGTGTLEARIETTISSRIQERLVEVLVDQGDRVVPGQLLARLDDTELRQQVAVAEASFDAANATVNRVHIDETRARAVLQRARLEYKRYAELTDLNFASESYFDQVTETLHIAEADLKRSQSAMVEAQKQAKAAEKNLQLRREQLTFTEISSPYDGLIVRRDRDPGVVVIPGSSILQLIDTDELWISAWVDETAMASLAAGQPARVVFRAEPDRDYPGQVARLGKEADQEAREFLVDVHVHQLPVNWAVGQRAEVYIQTSYKPDIVKIPQKFLFWRNGKSGVFLYEDGRANWRNITLGLYGQQHVEVVHGLSAGDQIVKLADNMKKLLEDGQAVFVP